MTADHCRDCRAMKTHALQHQKMASQEQQAVLPHTRLQVFIALAVPALVSAIPAGAATNVSLILLIKTKEQLILPRENCRLVLAVVKLLDNTARICPVCPPASFELINDRIFPLVEDGVVPHFFNELKTLFIINASS